MNRNLLFASLLGLALPFSAMAQTPTAASATPAPATAQAPQKEAKMISKQEASGKTEAKSTHKGVKVGKKVQPRRAKAVRTAAGSSKVPASSGIKPVTR